MTNVQKIKYNGPPELDSAWRDFADRFTKLGTLKEQVMELNCLDELVNTPILPSDFYKKHGQKAFTLFQKAKNACEMQSYEALKDSDKIKLNNYILSQILQKWIEVLIADDLYLKSVTTISHVEHAKRANFLKHPERGGLLASIIISCSAMTLSGAIKAVGRGHTHSAFLDSNLLKSDAYDVLYNTLFIFDENKGDQEKTRGDRFKSYLYFRILSILNINLSRKKHPALSLDHVVDENNESFGYNLIADSKAQDPSTPMEKIEETKFAIDLISHLSPRESDIIKMRFGLTDDGETYTLNEIGKKYGISRERIRQIEHSALQDIRLKVGNIKPVETPSYKSKEDKALSLAEIITKTPPVSVETVFATLCEEPDRKNFNNLLSTVMMHENLSSYDSLSKAIIEFAHKKQIIAYEDNISQKEIYTTLKRIFLYKPQAESLKKVTAIIAYLFQNDDENKVILEKMIIGGTTNKTSHVSALISSSEHHAGAQR